MRSPSGSCHPVAAQRSWIRLSRKIGGPGLSSVGIGELALRILKRGGLSNAEAVAAFGGLIAINYGWASFTAARDLDPDGPRHDLEAMLLQLPAEHFPLTVATAAEWGSYGSDDDYDFVLGRFLSGLAK